MLDTLPATRAFAPLSPTFAAPTPSAVYRATVGLALGAYHDGRFSEAFVLLVSSANPEETPDHGTRAELLSMACLAAIHLEDPHGASAAFDAALRAAASSGLVSVWSRVADQAAWAAMLLGSRRGPAWEALRGTLERLRRAASR